MQKRRSILKVIHEKLAELLAEFPVMMWVALFLDCLLILYMLLLGVDGIVFPSRMTTLRMVIGVYGVVNAIFFLIAGYDVIGEASPERESCPEDRLERYGNIIAPMLVLFPILAPMWVGFIVTLILTFIGNVFYKGYKKLEVKVLK